MPAAGRAARVAVVGAGMAGLTAARTLAGAGLEVTLLDKSRGPSGRMATRRTAARAFDHGAQFFTVRDARFGRALQATQAPLAPWRATFVRVLSDDGRQIGALPPDGETRWLPVPGMNALPKAWVAHWLADHPGTRAHWNTPVQALRRALVDVTGIGAEPALAVAHRWRYAQTQRALGEPFLWDAAAGLGLCGDWCLGHRVEHAFLSGLELALAVAAAR